MQPVIFILVLIYYSHVSGYANGFGASMVRVGGFDSYRQCMDQGKKISAKHLYEDYACIPVNHS